MGELNWGADTVLGGLILIILWFLRRLLNTQEANNIRLNERLDEISTKIKSDDEILAIVNGKYVRKSEVEMYIKERDEWRGIIKDQINKIDQEILRLRDHNHNQGVALFGAITNSLNTLAAAITALKK